VLCEQLESSDCDAINPTPGPDRNCMVRGRTLPNGGSIKVSLISQKKSHVQMLDYTGACCWLQSLDCIP
jgi:hypothetical protein